MSIFLNLEEFAEKHRIEGKQIPIVTDNDRLQELKSGAENDLTAADLLFYAKIEDLPPKQGYGSILNFDGTDWFVVSWEVNFGMAEIALTRRDLNFGQYYSN